MGRQRGETTATLKHDVEDDVPHPFRWSSRPRNGPSGGPAKGGGQKRCLSSPLFSHMHPMYVGRLCHFSPMQARELISHETLEVKGAVICRIALPLT
jgi:hypothetical protein